MKEKFQQITITKKFAKIKRIKNRIYIYHHAKI